IIKNKLVQLEDWLGRENYKSFYLAFLRVAVSLWFLKELYINWPSLEILYSSKSFIVTDDSKVLHVLPGSIAFLRNHYMIMVMLYIAVIFFNILGIGRWFTGLIFFIMTDLFEKL